jgi:hypothetical protein
VRCAAREAAPAGPPRSTDGVPKTMPVTAGHGDAMIRKR